MNSNFSEASPHDDTLWRRKGKGKGKSRKGGKGKYRPRKGKGKGKGFKGKGKGKGKGKRFHEEADFDTYESYFMTALPFPMSGDALGSEDHSSDPGRFSLPKDSTGTGSEVHSSDPDSFVSVRSRIDQIKENHREQHDTNTYMNCLFI